MNIIVSQNKNGIIAESKITSRFVPSNATNTGAGNAKPGSPKPLETTPIPKNKEYKNDMIVIFHNGLRFFEYFNVNQQTPMQKGI